MRALTCACLPICLIAIASPTWGQDVLSVAQGNWAGASNAGFYFRAELSRAGDAARLRIWHDLAGVPAGGDAQFDNAEIAPGAFATLQTLQVLDSADGPALQVVTEFADEEAEGREVLTIRFLDNQFTVTGYAHQSLIYNVGGAAVNFACDLDLWNGTGVVDGVAVALPAMDFEEKNASLWVYGTAFDQGLCVG